MSSSGTFVAKRFLRGINGDAINTDHIVRIYLSPDGKLYAHMTNGSDLQLYTSEPLTGSVSAMLPISFVGIG
jgi:hypothetical protein